MLVHIDRSAVRDAISDSGTAHQSHACIENLLLARFEGNHVVSLLPDDAASLRQGTWSRRACRALSDIEARYAQIAGLRKHVPWSLDLGIGREFIGDVVEAPPGRKVIRAPLAGFDRSRTTACAALLGENATDAAFFRELGLIGRALRNWNVLDMMHDARGTGGDTFATEFASVADRGHIVLAIADSDQHHPGGAHGATYRKLLAASKGRPAYQRTRSLPTRTAEGLVPLSVYQNAFTFPHDRGDARLAALTRLDQLFRSTPATARRYVHLKNGLTLYQVENPKTAAEGDYWKGIATTSGRSACARATRDQCMKREQCTCYVVDALGDKALADVLAWLRTKKSKKDLASCFGMSEGSEIRALADEVLAFGLALPPLQT